MLTAQMNFLSLVNSNKTRPNPPAGYRDLSRMPEVLCRCRFDMSERNGVSTFTSRDID